jgi:hypothetical protein
MIAAIGTGACGLEHQANCCLRFAGYQNVNVMTCYGFGLVLMVEMHFSVL